MKPRLIQAGMVILGVVLLAGQVFAEDPAFLKNQQERENYSTGVTIARNLKQQGGEVNLDVVIKGMMDELTGGPLLLTEDALRDAMNAHQNEQMMKQKLAASTRDENTAGNFGTMTNTMKAGRDEYAGALQQRQRPENKIGQADQGGLLAEKEVSDTIAGTAQAGDGANAVIMQNPGRIGQRNDPGNQLTPDGKIMSWRNQAKLGVQAAKADLRARAVSGMTVPNE